MSDNFCIGLGGKFCAPSRKLFLKIEIVFDDPVVHDDDVASAVRVGVGFGRPAMSCPAGMADSYRPDHWITIKECFQILQLTLAAAHRHMAVVHDGDPRGVIASVL